jgi:hypothetical protein
MCVSFLKALRQEKASGVQVARTDGEQNPIEEQTFTEAISSSRHVM